MTLKELVENIAYETLRITISCKSLESTQFLDVEHFEEDNDYVYFYGILDEPLKLAKSGLNISCEDETYNLFYPSSNIKISIKII